MRGVVAPRSGAKRAGGALAVALFLALLASLGPSAPTTAPVTRAQADPRFFPETGYRIANDAFFTYFQRRGGLRNFGYPVSNQFILFGSPVQIFQRRVMQQQPDGSVALLNLLDGGIMPYTRINGSTFPAADPALQAAAPSPTQPDYADAVLRFVQENAPDQFEGLPVNFYQTFLGSITSDEAFPEGNGDPALLPLIALELWGVPTSRPARDPNNFNFVYQRWQRGFMHFDATTGLTQGILLGDYFKAVLTGVNVPPDLALEAASGPYYLQYNPFAPLGLNRPELLPGSNLLGAFNPTEVAVPTPTPTPTPTPLGFAPSPTPTLSLVLPTATPPINPNPSQCQGDERMTFSPNPGTTGQPLLIAVTSAKHHVYTRMTGTETPTFVQERPGQLGWVWEWQLTPTGSGRYDFTFYIDSTVVCTANYVIVNPAPGALTPTPTNTPTSGPPTISTLIPETQAPGGIVTVVGSGFGATAGRVLFGTADGTVSSWTDTTINVAVPATLTGGTVQVKVVTSTGQQSNTKPLTVNVPTATPSPTNTPTPTPQVADPNRSVVSASPPAVDLSRGSTQTFSTITVTLLDSAGNPVPGKYVQLNSSSPFSTINGVNPQQTGATGQVTWTLTATCDHSTVLSATDITDSNLLIRSTATVTFYRSDLGPCPSTPTPTGGQPPAPTATPTPRA